MAENTRMNMTYVYGNTAPAYTPEFDEEARAKELRVRERRMREEEERRARNRARRALAREKRISRGNTVGLCFATALIFAACALYIQLNSQLSHNMNAVAQLESELINITAENDSNERRIETSVDLEKIRKKAMKELKMVYPSEDQIKFYHIEENDYMEQYKDIPSGKENSFFGMIFND